MNRLRAGLSILVFVAGIGGGSAVQQLFDPAPPPNPYRTLPLVPEPAASAQVASLLVANDAVGLSRTLEIPLLQRLASSIEPLVEIDEVFFTGATERDGDILSAYVAGGRAGTGQRASVGIVLRVRDGKVIGVN